MLQLTRHALSLFLEGKLFRDTDYFLRRLALGVAVTAGVMLAASFVIKSIVIVALIGGFVGGVLQPCLFEDVRYR